MDPSCARSLAEALLADDLEEDGTPTLEHVRRVAEMVPAEARPVAWLHELPESTTVTEQQLLMEGLTQDELRALRLLRRTSQARSDGVYLAHLELVAHAAGDSGRLARIVKMADLEDRCLYPRVRDDGWAPPYADALDLLLDMSEHRVSYRAAQRGPATPA